MEKGHQVKPVAKAIAIGFMLPEARDIMDYALEQYEEHKKQVQEMFNGEFPKEPVYSFAYWLFRWSGLIQYELPGEEAKPQAAAQVREAALEEAAIIALDGLPGEWDSRCCSTVERQTGRTIAQQIRDRAKETPPGSEVL